MRDIVRQKIVDSIATPMPEFTRRDVRLPGVKNKAVAVIGMRRTGKTTFLWQVISDRLAKGTAREGLLYFSFEDERLADVRAQDLRVLVEEYYRLHPEWRDRKRATFLLDEIQVVPGWETFARRLLDTEKVDLFLSGSSARLLSREVATSMRGRAMEALVHPFSFREYLRHLGREPKTDPDRIPKAARSALEKDLRTYLAQGGFPEVQGAGQRDRHELLKSYVDVALLRDVVERHAVSHPVALRWMVRRLLSNAARSFSVNKFYGDLKSQGFHIGKDTLHDYLGHLEDAFLVRAISIAADSERRRMVNPRKAYPVDPGLISVFDRSGRGQVGHALETCILLELERRGAKIAYVKTQNGFEVNFLARYPDGKLDLIQVCVDLDDPATREREIRALLDAKNDHPRTAMHVISLERPSGLDLPRGITLHSTSSWLLS
jgi:predicted AAA+ superfamily ATPase